MEMKNFKQLQNEDLRILKGGEGESIQNGDEIYKVDAFSLPIDPRFFNK